MPSDRPGRQDPGYRSGRDDLHGRGLVEPGRRPRGAQLRGDPPPAVRMASSRTTATPSACRPRSSWPSRTSPPGRPGYGIPGVVVDGSDVLACYRAARTAVRPGPRGDGPTLLEAKVLRLTGPLLGRPADEVPAGRGARGGACPRRAAALPRSAPGRRRPSRPTSRHGWRPRSAAAVRGGHRLRRGTGRPITRHGPSVRLRRGCRGHVLMPPGHS